MKGPFESQLHRDERIAAEVELYRQVHFSADRHHSFAGRGNLLYPVGVYSPSEGFLRRLAAARRS
jgi:hypothetical protein